MSDGSPPTGRGQPNIVLITADSLRADACGFVGAGAGTTPTLDRLAEGGVVFTNAVSPGPQTFSSMPAIFTGQPTRPWAFDEESDRSYWEQRLDAIDAHLARFETVAERLKAAGYATAAISPNPWTSTVSGFDRGFDHFLDLSAVEDRSMGTWSSYLDRSFHTRSSRLHKLLRTATSGRSFFATGEQLYDDLLALRERVTEPYFLWVFLLDTHIPYLTPREIRTENGALEMYLSVLWADRVMRRGTGSLPAPIETRLRRSYRDAVRSVDAFVARLWEDLREDDPVFVVHADHGESLGERGYYGHHHRRLYDENVHVPYLVANAGGAARIEDPISASSIPDVLAAIARDRRGFDPSEFTADAVVSRSENWEHAAVRGRRWKYIDSAGRAELFDLAADPGETTNLADSREAVVALFEEFVRARNGGVREDSLPYTVGRALARKGRA